MQTRELLLLAEMIDAAEEAHRLVTGLKVESIAADRQRRDALLWNFTVLGEAASQMSELFKKKYPGVNWSRPSQLRNRIVHGYWSIDLSILQTTAVKDLPGFAAQLRTILQECDDDA